MERKTLSMAVIKRFMNPEELTAFMERYNATVLPYGERGYNANYQLTEKVEGWLNARLAGASVREIADAAGMSYERVYDQIKRAALYKLSGK